MPHSFWTFPWRENSRKIKSDQGVPLFKHDALLLVGHGSSSLPNAARALLNHAATLRDGGHFAEAAVGMLNGTPNAADALRALTAPVVQVVPFFLEDGYFTRIAVPDLLAPLASSSQLIHFRRPIGTHGGIVSLIEARVLRHCEMLGVNPGNMTVLLAGHGSSRNPGRAVLARRHMAGLEAGGLFRATRVGFLEEAPTIADVLAASRGHTIGVVGYFANEGEHATQDLPRLIAEERHYRGTNWPPVHDLGSIGGDEGMPKLILDLVSAPR